MILNHIPKRLQNSRWILLGGIGLLSLFILALHVRYYYPFIADDALISLRYTRRFIAGLGLTWNDGEFVEGYSNLLWVLLTAIPGKLGFDLVKGARLLGLACTSLTLAALLYRNYRQSKTDFHPLASLAGCLSIVIAGPTAVWSIGGLEGPLVMALLAWAVVLALPFFEKNDLSSKTLLPSAILYGLLCNTRVDGAIFTVFAVLALFLSKGLRTSTLKPAALLAGVPLLFYIAQLLFRLLTYGQWVSNTTLVKVSPSLKHLFEGLLYVRDGLWSIAPLCFLALLSLAPIVFQKQRRTELWLPFISSIGYILYVAGIGGDIFPAWRMLVPLLPLLALLAYHGAHWLYHQIAPRLTGWSAYVLLCLLLIWYVRSQFVDPRNQAAKSETWEEYGRVIGLMLKSGFSDERPLLGVEPAGCLPYWSELPSLDLLGLNDAYIASHPPETFGTGWLGHELGDGDYVFSRQPDLLLFCLPWGSDEACYLSGKQMQQQPRFEQMYTPVIFEARKPYKAESLIFVHRYSSKIGIRQTFKGLWIPAYLMNGHPDSRAYLGNDGDFVVLVNAEQNAIMRGVKIPPGKYFVSSDPPGAFSLSIQSGSILSNPGTPVSFPLPSTWQTSSSLEQLYNLVITVNGEAELRGLLFTLQP